jgi:predicted kinase
MPRPCLDCGARTAGSSRCDLHESEAIARRRIAEDRRHRRQWYRAAYASPEYRAARKAVRRRSGGRCEQVLASGARCPASAAEAHHTVPLSTAADLASALALCTPELLLDVCAAHNPRGGRPSALRAPAAAPPPARALNPPPGPGAPRLEVLLGIPGAGKSTWVAEQAVDQVVLSLDAGQPIAGLASRAAELLAAGRDVIVDGTGLDPVHRATWLQVTGTVRARAELRAFACSAAVAVARVHQRPRRVPARVIRDDAVRFTLALAAAEVEGWDRIIVHRACPPD